MQEIKYVVKDELGLHARPAGLLVKEVATYGCSVTIGKGEKEVDARRIMGVMSLGVKCGDEITLKCTGEGEDEAAEKLQKFLEENL